MELKEAIQLILELAAQNMLDAKTVAGDEDLQAEMERQGEAFDLVEGWARHAL